MSVFVTVLSLSSLATILAALVSLADYHLNDYGVCTININGGTRTVDVNGGSSILSSLAKHKIFIPSACGGKATCGLCKVTMVDTISPVLPTEEPYLTAKEIEGGVRLACQVKVKRDLEILIPGEFLTVSQYQAKVEKITKLTYDIKKFRLRLLDPAQMEFKAGQYVQVDSKLYGAVREEVSRAYSISSAPSDRKAIELVVRLVPGGICTTFLHEHVKVGDKLTLAGPFGEFYLREGADHLIFIAGGSGLAPIRPMILDILKRKLDKKMTFFFGAVSRKDLFYVDYFRDLEARYPNFTYIPALSGAKPEDEWDGEEGLITEVVARNISDPEGKQAYLCGSPGMIDAALGTLREIGIGAEHIYYDKF
ncbi:MAG: 2Fe-2S iron-sulfur cluster binding domain-containing protein [Firmicutes bacterium]|nr:2Fe-2S iron-sulfur cluster binding domain-containing protein [Bacillota bacterium]